MTGKKASLTKEVLVLSKPDSDEKITINFGILKRASLVLRAINHPLRKEMIALLEDNKQLTVTDIYVRLRLEQSVASQHLAILRRVGVFLTTRQGKFIHYTINKKRVEEIMALAAELSE